MDRLAVFVNLRCFKLYRLVADGADWAVLAGAVRLVFHLEREFYTSVGLSARRNDLGV